MCIPVYVENVYRKYLESLTFWCFINYRLSANRYHLRAGSTYKDQGTIYTLKRIIVHPNYNSKTIDYDIALLQVREKIAIKAYDNNIIAILIYL